MKREIFRDLLKGRILVLDGAMGTLLQRYSLPESDFGGARGNYDYLNITRPELVREVHSAYLNAGADIIETNTFSSNIFSQQVHNAADKVYDLNFRGARIAVEAAEAFAAERGLSRRPLVAGSMGSMIRSLSIPSDLSNPQFRAVSFNEMAEAYAEQVRGLVEGGVDILLAETIYDALNAKAALYAMQQVMEEKGVELPVMISATVNDKSGRLLSGHRWDALFNALSGFPISSFGLNCSFGAADLAKFVEEIASWRAGGWSNGLPCAISMYPNAGLPNELGEYNEGPEEMASIIRELALKGALNIVGGCCGTTPEHIRAIADAVKDISPRSFDENVGCDRDSLAISGWESVEINRSRNNFVNVGERTNVAGSAKFARLLREQNYAEAVEVARKQIEDGATIIDINTDDPMSDGCAQMQIFLRYLAADPEVAKVPFMIDSSDWKTIATALRECGGKPIVNSISLKEGEELFVGRAREIGKLGAAVIVMAFDEVGQAVTFDRKIEICRRAYDILTSRCGFAPNNIIFDVNILSVATGIEEHDTYAVDFIRAVKWIKENLPGCKTSGGVSNLSFAFRGNNRVREAMHSVFLYHAIEAGLDMAIVNPAMLQIYSAIEPELLKCAEDVILNRHKEGEESTPTERLVALAQRIKEQELAAKEAVAFGTNVAANLKERGSSATQLSVDERLASALLKGGSATLEADLMEILGERGGNAVSIIEGPLMKGMAKVGDLFGEGKMFLPQVVKSAKVMKIAVEILRPYMQGSGNVQHPAKVLTATVKGDIHDIGKNIVCIVLECNNMEVIDLGVMVEAERILEEAIAQRVDVVGVSGLITPSLGEMEALCRLFESNKERILREVGHNIVISVGGAATSALHTAVKLAPLYSGGVIYGGDASQTALIIKRVISESGAFEEILAGQKRLVELYRSSKRRDVADIAEARRRAPHFSPSDFDQHPDFGREDIILPDADLAEILPHINWTIFFNYWGFKGTYPALLEKEGPQRKEVAELYAKALAELKEIASDKSLVAGVVLNFFEAHSQDESILIHFADGTLSSMEMPRQMGEQSEFLSAADYLPKEGSRRVGLFTLRVMEREQGKMDNKNYTYLMRQALCAALTEGMAEWLQEKISCGDTLIRVAIGYPMAPDHSLKAEIFRITGAGEKLQLELTENFSIKPSTAICGIIINHKKAKYHI